MNKTTVAQQVKDVGSLPSAQGYLQRKCACGYHTIAGGECAECARNKNDLQRKLTSGEKLSLDARAAMEPRFGYDFSRVRIHSNNRAAAALGAKAFTSGLDISYGPGHGPSDQRLLGHELSHVVQQAREESAGLKGAAGDAIQREALEERANNWAGPTTSAARSLKPLPATSSLVTQFDFEEDVLDEMHRKSKAEPGRNNFPWIGRIDNTWSAALRKDPAKSTDDPHRNTLADLPRGMEVEVIQRKSGWLLVKVTINSKALEGFVSQELVSYVKAKANGFALPVLPEAYIPAVIPLAEAFVELKRAEKMKAFEPSTFKLSQVDKVRIDRAIDAINRSEKYVVDESTYIVTFAPKSGSKTEIESIEDFILFVEQVEKQYSDASPQEVASEIRQLWFSDENWELMAASHGIRAGRKEVDLETEPDPIASQFNIAKLAPHAGSKQFDTRMGRIDIGHVMAGIDARLSGFPLAYPGSESDTTLKLKYETLKTATGGDNRDFLTWAGDLGEAYAEYLVERYIKGNPSTSLLAFTLSKAPLEEILGDIHGYIAIELNKDILPPVSPTGMEHRVSNILRDMYLVDKPATGNTYQKYFERISGKSSADLKAFITERSLRFARPWYVKKAVEHRGLFGNEGFNKEEILKNTMEEFDVIHAKNEKNAKASDQLESSINNLLEQLSTSIE